MFLKILVGVPVSFSFLTSSIDLSRASTVPVAEMRKSDYEKKRTKNNFSRLLVLVLCIVIVFFCISHSHNDKKYNVPKSYISITNNLITKTTQIYMDCDPMRSTRKNSCLTLQQLQCFLQLSQQRFVWQGVRYWVEQWVLKRTTIFHINTLH